MYAERYIELTSLLFDLYTFIPYFNTQQRIDVVTYLESKMQVIGDGIRKARASINVHKLRKIAGLYTFKDDLPKTLEIVKNLHNEYLSSIDLDGKPEKGERKIADDLVYLISDLLAPFESNKIEPMSLYRIAIMEFAMEKSPYNFDIQL